MAEQAVGPDLQPTASQPFDPFLATLCSGDDLESWNQASLPAMPSPKVSPAN